MTGYAGHAEQEAAPVLTGELSSAHLEAAESLLLLIKNSKNVRSWREGDDAATYHDPAQLSNALAKLLDPETLANIETATTEPVETFQPLF